MKLKSILGTVLIAALVIVAIVTVINNNEQKKTLNSNSVNVEENVQAGGLKVGQKAPNFTLQTLDGKEVSLADFKGKKVMINFWATWCPPCRAETPDLVKYYNDKAEQENFVILSVNAMSTESKSEKVKEFIDEYKMTYPVVIDPRGELISKYEVMNFPTSFFVNTKGVIQEKLYVLDEKQLDKTVKSID